MLALCHYFTCKIYMGPVIGSTQHGKITVICRRAKFLPCAAQAVGCAVCSVMISFQGDRMTCSLVAV